MFTNIYLIFIIWDIYDRTFNMQYKSTVFFVSSGKRDPPTP